MFDKLLPFTMCNLDLWMSLFLCDVCLFLLHFLMFINSFCFSACLCFVFYSSFGYLILKCMLQPVSPSDPCSAMAVTCMVTEWRECGHQAFCSPHSRGVTVRTPTFDLSVILISVVTVSIARTPLLLLAAILYSNSYKWIYLHSNNIRASFGCKTFVHYCSLSR